MAGSTERILRRVSFYACFEGKPPSPPKMTFLRVLEVLSPQLVTHIVVPLILQLSILRKDWSVE
jgi:hypothetical protein